MSEEPYCWKCSQLKPRATPVEIMYAHEDRLSDGFGFYGGRAAVEHVVEQMLRAEKERAKRLEAVLRQADTALLRALSDLMGYEDGGRTATQDLVTRAAAYIRVVLREELS